MTAIQAIEIQGLRKKYGSFEALKGIDLEVHTGEIFGFLGPNGKIHNNPNSSRRDPRHRWHRPPTRA